MSSQEIELGSIEPVRDVGYRNHQTPAVLVAGTHCGKNEFIFFNYFGFYGPNIVLSCQKKQNKKTRTLTAGYYVINDGVRPLEAINRQDQKSPLPYDRYFVSPQNESHYVLPR